MINRQFYILIFFLLSSNVFGQDKDVSFEKLLGSFKNSWRDPFSGRLNDSVNVHSLYKTKEFNVSISENPIPFDTVHFIVSNPYYTDNFDDYDDNYINYPISFSVIHNERLISLFRNGKFVCHTLNGIKRDLDLEQKLNTKRFKYHWIIDGQLSAMAGGILYVWSGEKWTTFKNKFPLKKQPKLFEDNEFIVFSDCHGEFGGTVYFFDKISRETYYTESTCANTVFNKDGKYFVLADLGHMGGSTEIKSIDDPRKLTKTKRSEINKTHGGQALGYKDKSLAFKKMIDFYGIQLLGTFNYRSKQLYIVYLNELTFLAEIEGNEIKIVHPLFDNQIYTHNPVTNSYGDYTLMNLDFYGTALDKEVSVIIIDGNKITKVDWNEKHSR